MDTLSTREGDWCFAVALFRERSAAGLTVDEAAELVGVARETWRNWESGRIVPSRPAHIAAIRNLFPAVPDPPARRHPQAQRPIRAYDFPRSFLQHLVDCREAGETWDDIAAKVGLTKQSAVLIAHWAVETGRVSGRGVIHRADRESTTPTYQRDRQWYEQIVRWRNDGESWQRIGLRLGISQAHARALTERAIADGVVEPPRERNAWRARRARRASQ